MARAKTKRNGGEPSASITLEEAMQKVLTLDISGASTGWAIGEKHALVAYGKYVSNLKHSRSQRLFEFKKWLDGMLQKHKPTVILIEKPYLGRNGNVLANLSKFVAAAEISVYESLSIGIKDEWFIDPRAVKKALRVRKPNKGQSTKSKHDQNKQIMVQRINELYGLHLKYESKSKKKSDDDCADAIALLHFWWMSMGRAND